MSNRKGRITDEEARIIEKELPFSTYEEVAKKLGRNPSTVRKFAQREGITKDKISSQKYIANEIKTDPLFSKMEELLNEDEIVAAHSIYKGFMEQFGGDILYSERQQIVDYAIVDCLLNREIVRQKQIEKEYIVANEKIKVLEVGLKEAKDADDDEAFMNYQDDIAEMGIVLADLKEDRKHAKDSAKSLMDRKEKSLKSMNASREARANELTDATQNFENLVQYLKKNVDKRRELGIELAKMRLAVKEEFLRLSQIHQYADKEFDYPVFNSEVVERELGTNEKEE